MVITLKYTHDEENMSVWVQGDCIASFNHDSDGWEGMNSAKNLITKLAKAFSCSVDIVYVDSLD